MFEIARSVRFCISFDPARSVAAAAARDNTFAGWPSLHGLGAYYEIEVTCAGQPDAVTGYLVNIAEIDEAVRDHAVPLIERVVHDEPDREPAAVLRALLPGLRERLTPTIRRVSWRLTPYYCLSLRSDDMHRILISQQFEFAAAHRLHVASMGDEENRRYFGKCNAPHGHGHNYRVEVAVSTPLDEHGRTGFDLAALERIVNERVVQRFDHTHLNLDTREFSERNPSVEHITQVCYDLLAEPIGEVGGRLERVTVWETGKTSCTYPAPGEG